MQYVLTEKRSTTLGKPLILWENYSIILKYNVYVYQYFKPFFQDSMRWNLLKETSQGKIMKLPPLANYNLYLVYFGAF